jgi:predicted DCC family thiol-disulfide oxidoreductase YuxK
MATHPQSNPTTSNARILLMSTPTTPMTVYFDGSCPLCRTEIGVYQKADDSNTIQWCDVSNEVLPIGLTRDQAMARFHVRNEAGQMVSGARAFIALWLTLPRWRWVGRIASVPPLPWLLEGAYRVFLPLRPVLQKIARNI